MKKYKTHTIKRIVFQNWLDSYWIAYDWQKVLTAFNFENLIRKINLQKDVWYDQSVESS